MKKTIIALLAAVLMAGCSGGQDDGKPKSIYATELKAGSPAVDFLYRDMDGRPFRLTGQRGKVVLLYFWRMKCEECKSELRSVDAMRKRYAGKGLVVVAVGADSMHSGSLYDVNKFLDEQGFGFIRIRDEDGFVAEAYRVMRAPEVYVIDRDGTIADIQKGPADWNGAQKTALIEKLLDGGAR